MGLLSWRRSARGPSSAPKPPAAPAASPEPAAAPEREIIRASSLSDVPDWARLPPIPPLLPEMPLLLGHFEDSLVSWQPPERFLAPLGHSISESAPSGTIEGMAILSPPDPPPEARSPSLADETASGEQPLILAGPSAAVQGEGRRSHSTTRRLDLPVGPTISRIEVGEAPAPVWSESAPPAPSVQPAPAENPSAASSNPPSESGTGDEGAPLSLRTGPSPLDVEAFAAPEGGADQPAPTSGPTPTSGLTSGSELTSTSELVGMAPLASAITPLVAPQPVEEAPSRLIHAATPPDMPLAYLPSAPLPPEVALQPGPSPHPVRSTEPGSPAAGVEGAAPVSSPAGPGPDATTTGSVPATSGLVGQRAIIDGPATAGPGPAPIVSPSPPPSAGAGPLPLSSTPTPPGREPPAVAPLVGETPPLAPEPPTVPAGPAAPLSASADDPGTPGHSATTALPLVQPQAAGPDAGDPASVQAPAEDPGFPADPAAPVAPLLGQGPPLTSEAIPLAPESETAAAAGGDEAGPPARPLAPAPPPQAPRAGLGEPLPNLPSTATSWDITTLSRAQQVAASRALIRSQMAAMTRSGIIGSAGLPLPPPGPPPTPAAGPATPRASSPPVVAGMSLARVALTPVEQSVDEGEADLPPASVEQVPLLSTDRLFRPVEPEPVTTPSEPTEGTRVRTAVGQRQGMDLSAVPVNRTTEGASEVHRLGARAFAFDRGVVIPPSAGSLEAGPGEALLAHELTHVAQRARLGPNLPEEFTPAGRLLEAEAVSAEMAVRTGASGRSGAQGLPSSAERSGGSGRDGGGMPGATLPLAAPGSSVDADSLAVSILDKMSVLSPVPGPTSAVFTPPSGPLLAGQVGPSWSSSAIPPPAPAAGLQRADDAVALAPQASPQPSSTPEEPPGRVLGRPTDEELSNLSRWLYPLIRYRLKGELREDRERAGLLTEHYRRW